MEDLICISVVVHELSIQNVAYLSSVLLLMIFMKTL